MENPTQLLRKLLHTLFATEYGYATWSSYVKLVFITPQCTSRRTQTQSLYEVK